MLIKHFNLRPELYKYLDSKKILNYTEIQEKVIPLLLKKKQLLVEAPTGTGKTLSFLLPILTNMNLEILKLQTIIFVPTRELGKQISDVLNEISKFLPLTQLLAVGGKEAEKQNHKLQTNPQIIIATPSRLKQLIDEASINLNKLEYVVVDEADMALDFGFLNQAVDFINEKIKHNIIWSMFSASLHLSMQNFIKKNMNIEMTNITVLKDKETVINYLIRAIENDKKRFLIDLINSDKFNPFISIIFCKTNKEVDELFKFLKENNIKKIGRYTSDMTPRERAQIIKMIDNGDVVYLITTDVMSRGIDILGITHIVNYSFPTDLTFYRHRIGRTNRNSISGNIYTIFIDSEQEIINKLKKQNNFIDFKNLNK